MLSLPPLTCRSTLAFILAGVFTPTVAAADGFLPHAVCYLWDPALLAVHAISDSLIGLAYVAISASLGYLVYRARRDIPYSWMFIAFGTFIVACGATHFMEVWTLWSAQYWQAGGVKVVTAVASITTALVLPPVIPHALALIDAARLSAERKRQLETAHRELEDAYERIKELDHQKTAFFANVSHDLRTPLTLIIGRAESALAAEEPLPPLRRDLTAILRNASTLLGYVNNLLDVAKIEAGRQTINYARVDLAYHVRTVAAYFESLAPQRSVAYEVATPESLESDVDPEKFERILLNLLSNAFKFTPAGGCIRCALDLGPPDRLRLSVEDSGPGIKPELRAAIFERFRQAESGTTRELEGTGLGLTIAKDFVDLHGGTIAVSDARGGGARFEIDMPQHAPPGAHVRSGQGASPALAPSGAIGRAVNALQPVEADPGPEPRRTDGPFILVAEDNADMRRYIVDVLGGDYRVVTAADGAEALEKATAEPPDLVVTDLTMPKLGGDRLVAEMRAREPLTQVPVLVLSATVDEAPRLKLLAEAAQDYMTKPFSAHELRARVRNLIAMKRTRDALQRELLTQDEDLVRLTRQIIANNQALQRSVEAREESERRWRAVYENSPVGIGLNNLNGEFVAANAALQRMLGYAEDELRTMSYVGLTPEEDREAAWSRMADLREGRLDEYHVERRYLRKDGSVAWADTSVSTMPATNSTPRMLVGIMEDITERKRAEKALADMHTELARVTRVTTMGELTASIAHEVNQPLTAVVSYGNACLRFLAAEPSNVSEAREAVQGLVREAHRASEVVARIRAFVRRTPPRTTPLPLDEVMREVLSLVQGEGRAHNVAMRVRSAPGLPAVAADRVQMQQVVLNLVVNAIEAMSSVSDRPRILEMGADTDDAGGVVVAIRDTGAGVEPAQAKQVFDAFYTTKPHGMGMGLAICRSIVEAHGGRLWATANPGGGSTFQFSLPAARVAGA